MSDIKIPPEVVEAAAEVLWNENGYITMEEARDMACVVIVAVLTAWPGMNSAEVETPDGSRWLQSIILPLQEPET